MVSFSQWRHRLAIDKPGHCHHLIDKGQIINNIATVSKVWHSDLHLTRTVTPDT